MRGFMRRVSRATRILRLVQDRAGITARLHRDLLYSPLESHFLKGILIENTPYKDTVYVWSVCMPLYIPVTHVVLTYSKRLKGGAYFVGTAAEIAESIDASIVNSDLTYDEIFKRETT